MTDPKITNKIFELPVAVVAKLIPKPCKEHDAPVLNYPQNGKGTCGVSALSSALYHQYNINLASLIKRVDMLIVCPKPVMKKSR